jgi:outer membrane receptor protein involved in Fe transport
VIGLLLGGALAAAADLHGFVLDREGRPLAGVEVEAGGAQTVTDAEGGWRLNLPDGPVELLIRAPGGAVPVSTTLVAGLSTEVLLSEGAPPVVQIESPSADAARKETASGPPGELLGLVVDDESGRPLAGVRVFVRGLPVEAKSDREGRFRLSLPEGERELSALAAGYGTTNLTATVVAHEERALTLRLTKVGLQLADLTVREPRIAGGAASLLDERQDASTVSDVLGAEQMSRSGDSDAASALRRVTGLTVIGGKYVYVRGLGDRYSATLLNGSSLPSPEPEKRVVPLDLFPTSLIEAVVIQKTFSPDRPGEFGGGVVEVRSRSIPEKPVLNISVSGSWDAGTTRQQAAFGPSGPTDWLGFGLEHRELPSELAAASAEAAIKPGGIFSEEGYSADELEAFGEMIPNRWGTTPRQLPPDFGLSASAGGTLPIGPVKLGAIGGFVYQNGWNIDEGYKATYSTGDSGLELKRRTDFKETTNRIRLGGVGSVGLSWPSGELRSTTLLMRSSGNSALLYKADDPTGSNDTESTRLRWEEQQLLFEQVIGKQKIGKLEIEGRGAFARANRGEPDQREYTYLSTDEGLVLSQRGSWNELRYSTLEDTSTDLGLDVSHPIGPVALKAGAARLTRSRTSTTRRFGFQFQGSEGIDLAAPISEVIVPENIGPEEEGDTGYLELEENTTSSDDYSAELNQQAAFLMGDVRFGPRVSSLLGARVEKSTQVVSTFELFDTSLTPVAGELSTTDLLPAATVTVGVGPDAEPEQMLVRFGYGRTLSRPELRELSQVAYYDYRSGRLLYGNPELERATIDNLDARWEWYPRSGESLSVGAFYKDFDHPIESVVAVSAVSGSVGTFAYAPRATNVGAELELRQRLDRLAAPLEPFYIAANGSIIRSRVDLSDTDGNQTSDTRPLQGQSPWVCNAQFGYEDPDRRSAASLLYNVFGPRIVDVGTSGIPDTYEEPVHRLDLVGSQGFGEHWSLRLKATNLLDWPIRETTGEEVSQESREGWSVGMTVGWSPL